MYAPKQSSIPGIRTQQGSKTSVSYEGFPRYRLVMCAPNQSSVPKIDALGDSGSSKLRHSDDADGPRALYQCWHLIRQLSVRESLRPGMVDSHQAQPLDQLQSEWFTSLRQCVPPAAQL